MPRYDLYYWPIPFRGHPVRFVLAQAGADWDEHGADEIVALTELPPAERPWPVFAAPILHDRQSGLWLSQMPAIMMYLGRSHGLTADPDQTLRVVCDLSDILLEVTRYHGEMLWDRPTWDAFAATRLPRWMATHQALAALGGVTAEAGYMFGAPGPGTADLALAAVWHTMAARLPGIGAMLREHAPAIAGLCARIAALPAIAPLARLYREPGELYCGGEIERSLFNVLSGG